MVALVHDNKVYAANAGDCQGVVVKNEKGQVSIRKINRKLNANSKKERARLRAEFTDDDIVVCKRGDEKACYVKVNFWSSVFFVNIFLRIDYNLQELLVISD